MGSWASKTARAVGTSTSRGSGRKYPTHTPQEVPSSQTTASAAGGGQSSISPGVGTTVHPRAQAEFRKTEAIKQDAADPDFQQMLKALGTLRLRDSAQTKNTEQMRNPQLRTLARRQAIEDVHLEESTNPEKRQKSSYIEMGIVREVLRMRDDQGWDAKRIENHFGLAPGVVDRLGTKSTVSIAESNRPARDPQGHTANQIQLLNLLSENDKLINESNKLLAKCAKLRAENVELRENDPLFAENDRLRTENDRLRSENKSLVAISKMVDESEGLRKRQRKTENVKLKTEIGHLKDEIDHLREEKSLVQDRLREEIGRRKLFFESQSHDKQVEKQTPDNQLTHESHTKTQPHAMQEDKQTLDDQTGQTTQTERPTVTSKKGKKPAKTPPDNTELPGTPWFGIKIDNIPLSLTLRVLRQTFAARNGGHEVEAGPWWINRQPGCDTASIFLYMRDTSDARNTILGPHGIALGYLWVKTHYFAEEFVPPRIMETWHEVEDQTLVRKVFVDRVNFKGKVEKNPEELIRHIFKHPNPLVRFFHIDGSDEKSKAVKI